MKKILATILALVLALGLCSVSWAERTDLPQADANGAITLDDDVTLASTWYISDGKTYTLNLNGHTLLGGSPVIQLTHGKLIINGVGTVKESTPYFGAVLIKGSKNESDENYSVLEVNSNVTLEGWAPIFVDQNEAKAYGVSVTVNGATLNAKKDTTGAGGAGIYVNGKITDENNAPVISLTNTKICDADNASQGMYLAGYATTTLTNCDITGMTGVEIRAGKLTVSGGAITGTATPVTVTPNGNGSTTAGAGVALAQHTTKLPVIVTIENATVKGYTGVYESNPQNNDSASIEKVNLTISGGNFEAINNGTNAVYSEDCTNFISGGTFSSDVSAYAGSNAVASLKNVYYVGADSIAAAVNSMSGGDTLTVIKGSVKVGNTEYGANQTYTKPTSYYYYPSTSDTTTSTTTKGSPKTFDAGVGIYAVTAVLSVTGMAWTAKKRH